MLERRHLTATVVAIAGCSPVTFRAWRNRNGLFPETQEAVGWNRFSEAHIAVVRLVTILCGLGITAQVAIDSAMETLPYFEGLFVAEGDELAAMPIIGLMDRTEDEPAPSVVYFQSWDTVAAALVRSANSAAIVVDLLDIAEHVVRELKTGDYPAIATSDESRGLEATLQRMIDVIALPPSSETPTTDQSRRKPTPPKPTPNPKRKK